MQYRAMNDAPHAALLPTGLYDLLPPQAELEAEVTARLMSVLTAHGYERVKPPLVEFEETPVPQWAAIPFAQWTRLRTAWLQCAPT
jgi:hypothetical protein